MNEIFKAVSSKVDFPAMEREILESWEKHGIVQKYLRCNQDSEKRFSFIDGPITANNPMGVHHAWGRTYKDLFLRLKTMQGFKQRYQNGFDGQGLWIEVEVEKELKFKSKRDIEAFGIDRFVELCKERVQRFADIITQQSTRLAQWMDWDDSYHTMSDENNYTIWNFLKVCDERGWIYKGRDVMPWCPRCGTGLSEHEIVTEGYQEIVHPGLYVKFPLKGRNKESLLVWTTTPWTLTSNIVASVHPDQVYVKVRQDKEIVYVMEARISVLKGEIEVLEKIRGKELIGLTYRGPFDELPVQNGITHKVVSWEEVSSTEGTGIVHNAPGAGKEDFALGKDLGLDVIAPLDEFGDFVDGFDWLTGRNVYDVNEGIYNSLREKGLLYHLEDFSHRYPTCWRCSSELVFRLVDEWFISMEELRSLIADSARKIKWVPQFGLERELDWLKNMDDWMISKKRYWGLALPIFECSCGNFDILGSESELEERAVEGWNEFTGHSPHRPWIDLVKIACSSCGNTVSRITDVGNPWLDAGIVPFSTLGYRNDKEHWSKWFPADWISESFPGQFRNWFYSLLTMSTVLENMEPTKAIFSYATMRDERGDEMHKSKGNAIWFEDGAEKMGVDTMRWLYTRQNPASNLYFGYGAANEIRRQFIIPLWNVYSFFVTYANIDRYDPSTKAPPVNERTEMDRWILSELNTVVDEVTKAFENFTPDIATQKAEQFVEFLSNWYVRRSRRRFWKSGLLSGPNLTGDLDKLAAYSTLYECLVTFIKLVAPVMPFVTESIHDNLLGPLDRAAESVHLESYPEADHSIIDSRLSDTMRLAMRLSSLGRAARSKAGVKVRQPLMEAIVSVPSYDERQLLADVEPQLLEELNVKAVKDASEVGGVFEFEIRPNFALLGPKYGSAVPALVKQLSALVADSVALSVERGQQIKLTDFVLQPEEVLVTQIPLEGYVPAFDSGYGVAVSSLMSPDLKMEGLARELVHRIQNMRRDAGFGISDYIITSYQGDEILGQVIELHGDYIRQETLSIELISGPPLAGAHTESHLVEDLDAKLGVSQAK